MSYMNVSVIIGTSGSFSTMSSAAALISAKTGLGLNKIADPRL
jgi:hypothetical protein